MVSADTLSLPSRAFFERTKMKMAYSLLATVFGLMILGFCSFVSGQAAANATMYNNANKNKESSTLQDQQSQYGGGSGFASFCFIVAFLMLLTSGLLISPLCAGSPNEKKTLRNPYELEVLVGGGPSPDLGTPSATPV